MTAVNVNVVLDNDRVVVRRVKRSGSGPVSSAQRRDRLIMARCLPDSLVTGVLPRSGESGAEAWPFECRG